MKTFILSMLIISVFFFIAMARRSLMGLGSHTELIWASGFAIAIFCMWYRLLPEGVSKDVGQEGKNLDKNNR